jgi:hypothetical protein
MRILALTLIIAATQASAFSLSWLRPKADLSKSVARVRVTSQNYRWPRPWEEPAPASKEGLGTYIGNNRLLVTADLVRNATFVELERIGDANKTVAKVENVDYFANLAVVTPEDKSFLADMKALQVREKSKTGDTLEVWQFEPNGTPVIAEGTIKAIEASAYTTDSAFLTYSVRITLSSTGSSYVLPVIQGGKLAGISLAHSQNEQTMTLIPGPVIAHYLSDLNDGDYQGFPRGSFSFVSLEDPQLRHYSGLNGERDGIFVSDIRPGGSAEVAGLKIGDVMLAMGGQDIDRFGTYEDSEFGRQSLVHLITTRHFVGDSIDLTILRDKEEMTISMALEAIDPQTYPIPPFLYDQAPTYIIVGGFVFQELSRQYLRAWGRNWNTGAPRRLVYYESKQWELLEPGQRQIILTQVLPTPSNIGYHDIALRLVKTINGVELKSINDIPKALASPIDGFHVITFTHDGQKVYLDTAQTNRDNGAILKIYGLPALSRLDPFARD